MFDKDSFLAGVAVGRRLSHIGSTDGIVSGKTMEITESQEEPCEKDQENAKTNGVTY